MKKNSRFIIVTPNFNMGHLLEETIISVLNNISSDDEYYIIDGGSTDTSIEIINKYSNKITGSISEPDHGYADAIAKGFAQGNGKYMCWINSGDLLLKGSLNMAVSLLDSTKVDMIFGDDLYIDSSSRVISFSSGQCRDLRKAMIYGDWTPLQDACFWSRSVYEKVGGIDITFKDAADYDLFARLSTSGRALYTPFTFSAFRCHHGQRSIKNKKSYIYEKEKSRKVLVANSSESKLSRLLNRLLYYVLIRWRARVLHKHWDIPALHNLDARTLICRDYKKGE
jgi:GT2 family glycosyltransferase